MLTFYRSIFAIALLFAISGCTSDSQSTVDTLVEEDAAVQLSNIKEGRKSMEKLKLKLEERHQENKPLTAEQAQKIEQMVDAMDARLEVMDENLARIERGEQGVVIDPGDVDPGSLDLDTNPKSTQSKDPK